MTITMMDIPLESDIQLYIPGVHRALYGLLGT